MCKLTKNLPIQARGLLDFQDSGRGFDKGKIGEVETPIGAMSTIFSVSYSSISGNQIYKFAWQNSEFGRPL